MPAFFPGHVAGREPAALEAEVIDDVAWLPREFVPEVGVWTDDFSSLLPIVRW